eukprot:TRINITY_DN22735_c0_g1_i1.p1 TRINITY_DN22735_c0_g1~~TRINITY_DN22735_c0_g1_i1.p1  ORF type:complete len:325 (+),score=110.50 TRINITY_DN22735_c0_g1_i1:94-975(+)
MGTGGWEEEFAAAQGAARRCAVLRHAGAPEAAAAALPLLRDLLSPVAPPGSGHGIDHAVAVYAHAINAVTAEPDLVTAPQGLVAVLAALLHDADDRKLFGNAGREQPNAVAVLMQVAQAAPQAVLPAEELVQQVCAVISLVSCSTNGNSSVPEGDEWKLIPRDADRVEALGEIGIVRAYQYALQKDTPLFTAASPRPATRAELREAASGERFARYRGGSASFIDHFYDKLLHVGKLGSGSRQLAAEAARRMSVMEDFCLAFGSSGVVDTAALDRMAHAVESAAAGNFSEPLAP